MLLESLLCVAGFSIVAGFPTDFVQLLLFLLFCVPAIVGSHGIVVILAVACC
jgi:hypothetical protein